MNISLITPVVSPASDVLFSYEEDLDCIITMLSDVSDIICESGGEFAIAGFGCSQWPVNYAVYLSVFLEGLPNAVARSKAGESFIIDIYEQGIECRMRFEPIGNIYIASCNGNASWNPDPQIEEIEKEKLYQMLISFQDTFLKFLYELSPELGRHPWIRLLFEHGFEHSMRKEYHLLS